MSRYTRQETQKTEELHTSHGPSTALSVRLSRLQLQVRKKRQ